jgi:2-keto-4-pentenoate hydratase
VPLSLSDSRTIAADLDAARRQRCAIAAPPDVASLSLRDAYDVQDALVAERWASIIGCSGVMPSRAAAASRWRRSFGRAPSPNWPLVCEQRSIRDGGE